MDDLNERVIAAAREWTADCLSDANSTNVKAADVTQEQAMQYVARWYGGGIATLRRDVEIGGF